MRPAPDLQPMMSPMLPRRCLLLASLLTLGCSDGEPSGPAAPGAGLASAAESLPSASAAGETGKSGDRGATHGFVPFSWHDGVRERTAWMDPARVSDHSPDDASRARLLAQDPGAGAEEAPEGSPRLWRLSARVGEVRALCAALVDGPGRFSPLFRENPSESSPARSAPGGVVLGFEAGWSAEAARAWAAERGLEVTRELDLGRPTLVIASPPGLAALERAEELRSSPALRYAQPDWWVAAAPY